MPKNWRGWTRGGGPVQGFLLQVQELLEGHVKEIPGTTGGVEDLEGTDPAEKVGDGLKGALAVFQDGGERVLFPPALVLGFALGEP